MKPILFLATGMFAMGFEDYLFAGLIPAISVSLHASIAAVAQGCALFGLAYVLSIPLCAFLLSKRTTRHVLIIALLFFIAGNIITLLSSNLSIYILSRFIAGVGGGLFLPVAVSAGTQLVDPCFRGRALSLMWSFNSAGAVVGIPLGLWVASRTEWRVTVILILILSVFALVSILFHKQELRVETPPSLRSQFQLLMNRRVLAVISVTFLTASGCLGLYPYISQVLSETNNSSEVAFSLWSIGGLIGSMGIGYVTDRLGKPQIVMAMILTILLLMITSIPIIRVVPIIGLLPFIFWGAMGWASVPTQQHSLILIKANHEAILVALNSSAVSLGGVVGTALGGAALAGGFAAEKLPYATSIFVFCALVFQILLIKRQQQTEVRV